MLKLYVYKYLRLSNVRSSTNHVVNLDSKSQHLNLDVWSKREVVQVK